MKQDWISYSTVLLLSLIWGSSFFLTAIALEAFHPFMISAGRILLSMVAIAAVAFALGERLPRGRAEWRWCAALGVFSLMLPFTALAWGQQTVPTATAAIFVSCGPLFVLALARIFLGQAITIRKWLGFVVGLLGLFWLIGFEAFRELG
ncbi:MAG: DMT family transporter, partial [Pseudomonadota bacterium]